MPPTENKGRRHTSTVAVAVMPCDENAEVRINDADLRISRVVGQGPGGQHRNKNATAIRITHVPTGITACSDSRSQHRNLQIAKQVIAARLADRKAGQKHTQRNKERSSQIGDMGRGMRVRTYSFTNGVVYDERVNKKFRIDNIMKGGLGKIYKIVKKGR